MAGIQRPRIARFHCKYRSTLPVILHFLPNSVHGSQSTYREGQLPPVGVRLLEDGEQLQYSELAPVVIDTQMLSFALDGGQGAHGHPDDGVALQQLPHHGTLILAEVKTDILEGSFLRAQRSRL